MYVKCLGSGDAFGSGGRLSTCFYIRTPASQILLDCGAAALAALKREKLSANDIDVILITHLHGDHFGGLPFILCELIAMGQRNKLLTIVGPEETKKRTLEALACFYPGMELAPVAPVKFVHYTAGDVHDLGDLRVIAFRAVHSPESNPHALRLESNGQVVAYSGDTEWTDELIPLSKGADLFICEASGYQSAIKNHLTVAEVLARQNTLSAKKIVLTHAGEEVLNHKNDIELPLAGDGEVLLDNGINVIKT